MSREIWVVSDTHFGHENIIRFCNRPFTNAEEMDEVLVENWNKVVKDEDIVYHLGDVYFAQGHKHLSKLKGRKRLILGNHDEGKDKRLTDIFQKILMWRMFPEFGLLLSHVPLHESSLRRGEKGDSKLLNVHGHIHQNSSPSSDHKNVSVEQIDSTPVNIDSLRIR